MQHDSPDTPTTEMPDFKPRIIGIALVFFAILLLGLWLVGRWAESDRQRDIQAWQEKLNLIAESREADINHWVAGNFKELRTLADNPSLQLYLSELKMMGNSMNESEPAQKSYLRNVMLFTAQRAGFSTGNANPIQANIPVDGVNMMAVLDNNNQIMVSTAMSPAMRDMMLAHTKGQTAAKETLIDLHNDKKGGLYIGFIVPVFSIQGDHNAESQIGKIIGIKSVDGNLFSLLKHPGATEKTLETILVREHGDKIDYLSPLEDGSAALSKQTGGDAGKLADARLLKTVGNFSSDLPDYRGKKVLATSRTILGTPWVMIVKIDAQEALSASEQRRNGMTFYLFMLTVSIAFLVTAMWWRANSVRALLSSRYFRNMANKSLAQEQLLRLVADHQPEPIYIVDEQQAYRFANQKMATEVGMDVENIVGKTLPNIVGAARAEIIQEQCRKALLQRQVIYNVTPVQETGKEKTLRSAYVPLSHIPIVSLPENTPGVLVIEQDISDIIREREQRLNTQRQLVQTLVMLVDKRDPFSANHSKLVSRMASEVAIDMELDDTTIETAYIAGSLMNIGKIVVPTELLTKTTSLSAQEKQVIRDSMLAAADLLSNISFDGPVAETLRQWQENWDGSGPLGLREDAILITARIIAVANSFIGMISPRAFRDALPIPSATKILLEQSGSHFDQKVVIALINYVDNHHGKAWLMEVLDN